MDELPPRKPGYKGEMIVGIGYFLLFCLAGSAFIYFYSLAVTKQAGESVNWIATGLPPLTPSPHIPAMIPTTAARIYSDDFSFDRALSWEVVNYDPDLNDIQVRDGRLYLSSSGSDYYQMARCVRCPYMNQPFLIQADLTTDRIADDYFGIVFHQGPTDYSFYVFGINPKAGKYFLFRVSPDGWSLRTSGDSGWIKPFPAVNRLGVYASGDRVELYINGQIVDSYQEANVSFQTGNCALYVGSSGFELIADDFMIYAE